MICISGLILLSKLIKEKYPNRPESHKLNNLVLIAEAGKMIRKNSCLSNVYTFLHAYFEGVESYATRRYLNLTKDRREEDLF